MEARASVGLSTPSGEPTGRSHRVTLVTIEGKQWLGGCGLGTLPLVLHC
ncbi:hypothetical protein OK016_15005 [Vibrio chagasii]|nr:hypothetical protein [Vibrio chagasii]